MPVIYEGADQEATLREFFKRSAQIYEDSKPGHTHAFWTHVLENAMHMALGFKNKSFKEEVEWRLISPHPKNGLKYRRGQAGVIPYSEIPFDRRCVAEIWLGPTLDHKMAQRTWESYLEQEYGSDHAGDPRVPVHASKIPLRSV
jgi:hypothetical protein